MPRTTRFPDTLGQVHCASIWYDVAKDGGGGGWGIFGGNGSIQLPGVIPAGALLLNGVIHIVESLLPPEGQGFSVALKTASGQFPPFIVALSQYDEWNAGIKVTDVLKPGDYDPVRLDVDTQLWVYIESASDFGIESGKFVCHLTYVMSLDQIID